MENTVPKVLKLNNGIEMPAMGFGTYDVFSKDVFVTAIMENGYRHIDTATLYNNEQIIGEALEECFSKGLKREEIFITTKLWHSDYHNIEGAIRTSLSKLKLDYIDLYLIHWPLGQKCEQPKPVHKVWVEMEDLVDKGLTKSIGISNFNVQMTWDLLCYARIKPVVNQVELNPQCAQTELVRFLKAKDIVPVGYTPVARPGAVEKGDVLAPKDWPDLRNNAYLQEVGAKYGKSVTQVMLNWGIARGCGVIPKAASAKWQAENMNVFDFRVTDEEIEKIAALDGNVRLCNKFFETFDFFA